ncbi:MAG: hypothetical protein ABI903_04900 [Actinomycetota bacterium]
MRTRRRALWSRSLVSGLVAVVLASPVILLAAAPSKAAVGERAPGGSYEALMPARIADTGTGLGGVPVGPTRNLVVTTAGRAGVPAGGVSAVAVNITIRAGSVGGSVTAYPTGSPRPATSDMTFTRRQTFAHMVVKAVNGAGQLTIEASAPAHFVVDVEGYFTSADTASTRGLFNPLNPARIVDARGTGAGALGPGSITVLQVTGRGGVPVAGVSAVVINTTITGATRDGSVTEYPSGLTRPATSTLSFAPGQTVANRAIVPVGAGGTISIYNDRGTTRPVIDVTGYFSDGVVSSTGGYFVPLPSARVVDTRFWQTTSYLSSSRLKTQKIAGQNCVLSPARTVCGRVLVPPVTSVPRPIAALINIIALPKDGAGYLSVFAAGSAIPAASDVSFASTAAPSNISLVGLGSQGEISVHNGGGLADVVVDVSGYFVLPVTPLPKVSAAKGADGKAPGHDSLLLSGPGGSTGLAPASIGATSGPTSVRPFGIAVGGGGALPIPPRPPSPASTSGSATQPSAAQRSQIPAPASALLQTPAPTTSVSQTPAPTTSVSQTPAPTTSVSQTPEPATAVSQTSEPGPAGSPSGTSVTAHSQIARAVAPSSRWRPPLTADVRTPPPIHTLSRPPSRVTRRSRAFPTRREARDGTGLRMAAKGLCRPIAASPDRERD